MIEVIFQSAWGNVHRGFRLVSRLNEVTDKPVSHGHENDEDSRCQQPPPLQAVENVNLGFIGGQNRARLDSWYARRNRKREIGLFIGYVHRSPERPAAMAPNISRVPAVLSF